MVAHKYASRSLTLRGTWASATRSGLGQLGIGADSHVRCVIPSASRVSSQLGEKRCFRQGALHVAAGRAARHNIAGFIHVGAVDAVYTDSPERRGRLAAIVTVLGDEILVRVHIDGDGNVALVGLLKKQLPAVLKLASCVLMPRLE